MADDLMQQMLDAQKKAKKPDAAAAPPDASGGGDLMQQMLAAQKKKLARGSTPPGTAVSAQVQTKTRPGDFPGLEPGEPKPGFLTSQGIDPGAAGRQVRASVAEAEPKTVSLQDPNFDAESGIGFDQTRRWMSLDNEAEKKKFLDAGVKAGRWTGYGKTVDTGQDYVVINGKPTAVVGTNVAKDVGASVAAHPFETTAMVASTLIPETKPAEIAAGALYKAGIPEAAAALFKKAIAGTGYNVVRGVLTGAAGTVGAAFDEAVKYAEGLFAKTPKEQRDRLVDSFLTDTLTEAGLRSAGSIVRAIRQGYSKFIDPEIQKQVANALKQGMRPSVAQAVPPSKLLPFEQRMAQYIWGNPAEKKNIEGLSRGMVQQLINAGYPRDVAERLVANMKKEPGQVRDPTATRQMLSAGAEARLGRSGAAADVAGTGLRQDINTMLDDIDRRVGSSDPGLQQQVQADITKARQVFGGQATAKYDAVDRIIGGQKVYNTSGIRAEAQRIIDAIPKDKAGKPLYPIPQDIQGAANLPDQITFADAQRLRSSFARAGQATDLTPGVAEHEYSSLSQAVDDGFKQAATSLPPGVAAGDAARALRAADDFYKTGITRFQQTSVKQLGKEAELTHFADPEKVANVILRPGFTAQAARIKSLVSPETWKKVGAAFWDGIKSKATIQEYAGSGRPMLDGKKLLDQLTKSQKSLAITYGPAVANDMLTAARRLAAVDGKIDLSTLSADNFGRRVESFLQQQEHHNALLKDNFIQMLAGRSQVDKNDAVKYIIDNPNLITKAKTFYGEASPEWREIQKQAMMHMMQSAMGPGGDLLSTVMKPGGLSGMLRQMPKAAQDELFGPGAASELRDLGKQIDFMTTNPTRSSTAAFAVAGIVLHPLVHIGTLADLALSAHIMSSEVFLRWLSLGLKGDTRAMKIAGNIAHAMGATVAPSVAGAEQPVGQDVKNVANPTLQLLQQ